MEAGAGIGTVSQLVLDRAQPTELTLVEPAQNNIPALRDRFAEDPRVRVIEGYLEKTGAPQSADSVIAVNVMEHILRDRDFLHAAYRTLVSDGALLLLVPAVPAIYGTLDRAFDHYRRYSKTELRRLLLDTGFRIERLHYINSMGVFAWFFSGTILRRKTISRRQARLYDRLVIPWLRRLESVIHPPIGQSLLAIARKPSHSGS